MSRYGCTVPRSGSLWAEHRRDLLYYDYLDFRVIPSPLILEQRAEANPNLVPWVFGRTTTMLPLALLLFRRRQQVDSRVG